MTLWFVTPAHRRFQLSEICFAQRRRVIDELEELGIVAQCVVIADDDNLALARTFGFETVTRGNRWLGQKFNDGFEFALKNGAEWIVPIGSDDWIDTAYLAPLPAAIARTSRFYAPVEHDRLAYVTVDTVAGAGPRVFHRSAFNSMRPSEERIRRGVDRSVMASFGEIAFEFRDIHPLQYVGFRGDRHITLYAKILAARGGEEHLDPWDLLKTRYPSDLVDLARTAMASVRRPRSVGRLDTWGARDRIMLWLGRIWPDSH